MEEKEEQKLTVIDRRKMMNPEDDISEEKKEEKQETKVEPDVKEKPVVIRRPLADEILKKEIEDQIRREKNSKEIRCPLCRYASSGFSFLYNQQNLSLVCPRCGIFFMQPNTRLELLKKVEKVPSNLVMAKPIPGVFKKT